MRASPSLSNLVEAAIWRVFEDSRAFGQPLDGRSLVRPGLGEPNLITNLSEAIRQRWQRQRDQLSIAAVRADGEDYGNISVDAIGGAVRTRFGGREFAEPGTASIGTVTGALLLGYSLAESSIGNVRSENPIGWAETVDRLPPPWQVTHPILLDPALWMLGTALPEN
jgi:hypothetical protein